MIHKTTLVLLFSLVFMHLCQDDVTTTVDPDAAETDSPDIDDSDSDSSDSSDSGDSGEGHQHREHRHHNHNHNHGPRNNGNGPRNNFPPLPPPVNNAPLGQSPPIPANHGCGSWKYFSRPTGGWCMQVFAGELTQPQATAKCTALKAKLSGIQNANERKWILKTTMSKIKAASGAVWIGAKRRAACIGKHKTAACPWYNSFEWTDGSATGKAGYKWNHTQPDNAWLDQNCAQLIASNAKYVHAKYLYVKGNMDDISCTATYPAVNAPRKARAYICGKKATY